MQWEFTSLCLAVTTRQRPINYFVANAASVWWWEINFVAPVVHKSGDEYDAAKTNVPMCSMKVYNFLRLCAVALSWLMFAHGLAWGYESDVHYGLTKFLALWAGFSESEAGHIANADQELDDKPEFNPLPNQNACPKLRNYAGIPNREVILMVCKDDPEFQRMLTAQRAYHFVDGLRLNDLRNSAFRSKNLKMLGHYLHALQDSFSHSLMDYSNLPPLDRLAANLGALPDEKIFGHLWYGYSVDRTYERPDLAEMMARYVYIELTRFKGSPNRWTEFDASIARFVRERDFQKKHMYLTATPAQPIDQGVEKRQGGQLEQLARSAHARRPIATLWSSEPINVYELPAVPDGLGKPTLYTSCLGPIGNERPVSLTATVKPGELLEIIDILDQCRDYFGPPVLVRTLKSISGYVLLDHTMNKDIPSHNRYRIDPLTEEGMFKIISLESIKCEGHADCILDYYVKPYQDFLKRFPHSKYSANAAEYVSLRYSQLADMYERLLADPEIRSQYGDRYSRWSSDAFLKEAQTFKRLSLKYKKHSEQKDY